MGGYVIVDVEAFDRDTTKKIAQAMAASADEMVQAISDRALLDQVPMRDIVSGSAPLPAPTTIAEAVAKTITACPESVRSVLSAGAVIGAAFDAALVSVLTGLSDATLLLDQAIAAGLICEAPGVAGPRLTFSHALVHRAVYEQTGLARRRELHLRAARMMSGAEALRHRVAAADGTDPVLADDLERQAAVDVSHGELASAAMHREQALYRTPPGPERTSRLLAVVEAELVAGDAVSARRFADELAAGGGDPWWDYVAGYQSLLDGQVGEAGLRLCRALDAAAAGSAPARAPADLRARVASVSVLGIDSNASFEVSVADWVGSGDGGPPTRPELAALGHMPVLCIYGEGEEDSICPALPAGGAVTRAQVGKGHHFSGEYGTLADRILAFARSAHPVT